MIEISLQKTLSAGNGPFVLDIRLEVRQGEFLAITGPSGSGKTTLLRLLAGLMAPDEGRIAFGEQVWLDTRRKIHRRPQDRDVGLVFQDYALFPNMSVRQNLEYALAKEQSHSVISELMHIIELEDLADSYPDTLSGGQQQRVALARALVRRPKLLLLDEPLSALDAEIRAKLQNHIQQVHEAFGLTTILVSHDYREIFKLASRVIALKDGRALQPDLPETVHLSNSSDGNFMLRGEVLSVEEEGADFAIHVLIGHNVLRVPVAARELQQLKPGDSVELAFNAFRPELAR